MFKSELENRFDLRIESNRVHPWTRRPEAWGQTSDAKAKVEAELQVLDFQMLPEPKINIKAAFKGRLIGS